MLKALEIVGFKSFADKTRFEFPDGITVVVGPNGSGKSNIVDAIKWVLGEQSAKSLRGKEMADVIFKGSGGPGGRKPANTAEATLVFDNSQGLLPVETPEVLITRRVYRSGEGEYMINRKPCRLKDIRDLCRGTGAGVDAYSLIEQGKVDRLLQASAKDRRAIFEEAAGISRFKAKKIEAQRRLARVDQNLLRLSDIVDEVESRLRSVRSQAAKAQKYREHTQRLQELRTHVGLADWRKLSQQLQDAEQKRQALQTEAEEASQGGEELEASLQELEENIAHRTEALREAESYAAEHREVMAALDAERGNHRQRCEDFQEQADDSRKQWLEMARGSGELVRRLEHTRQEFQQAETDYRQSLEELETAQAAFSQLDQEIKQQFQENEQRRHQYMDQMQTAAMLGNQVSGYESQRNASGSSAERSLRLLKEMEETCAGHAEELDAALTEEKKLSDLAQQKEDELEAAEIELAESRRMLARRQEEQAMLQGRHTGSKQRADVLLDLERQSEGVSPGVREVIKEAQRNAGGWGGQVQGMVADLVEASVEVAPLVDVALGERSQYLVTLGDGLLQQIRDNEILLTGRVGVIRMDKASPLLPKASPLPFSFKTHPLQNHPGVLGRADQMVRTQPAYQELIKRLLGDTWFVENLSDALQLSRTIGRGQRFVTAEGELIDRDGVVTAGPPQAAAALVSRRSELRNVQKEIVDLQKRIVEFNQEIARLQENIDQHDQRNRQFVEAYKQIASALAEQSVRTRTLQQRYDEMEKQRGTLAQELRAAQAKHDDASRKLQAARDQLTGAKTTVKELEEQIQVADRKLEELDQQRRRLDQEVNRLKVHQAGEQQRLEALQSRRERDEKDYQERRQALEEIETQRLKSLQKFQEAELNWLQANSALADSALAKEILARRAAEHLQRQRTASQQRADVKSRAQKAQRLLRKLEEQRREQDSAVERAQLERKTLAERMREDYGIELAELEPKEETAEESSQRQEIETEIADLRNKINRIGSVNTEALNELDDLQERYESMAAQYEDLQQAKASLERIIDKINGDSRRLFVETLEAIRANFQILYRKAFGGGSADIVLEEGKDVLECGVDIVATPPGKPSFNNSLLSGGEKALTAVSLLLAIFQFRPSPFCILDEVDAPFDEANVGRFVDVLKEFLSWTKFVIVTHSKKTMTAATTLYGVTMQESGVSKRVSVRFEDVSEDGQIREEAVKRAA